MLGGRVVGCLRSEVGSSAIDSPSTRGEMGRWGG